MKIFSCLILTLLFYKTANAEVIIDPNVKTDSLQSISSSLLKETQHPKKFTTVYDFSKQRPLCKLLPQNNLNFPTEYSHKKVNFKTFMKIIQTVDKIFAPQVRSRGSILKIHARWTDPIVDAEAYETPGVYHIIMFGGLARHPKMTADGFALVLCHELGHHLGGAPFYPSSPKSNEGQSDYFATLQCMKRVLIATNSTVNRSQNSRKAVQICNKRYGNHRNKKLVDICIRSISAGKDLGSLISSFGDSPSPRLATKDLSIVDETLHGHPPAQCRFDTYVAGALCSKNPYRPLTSNPKKHTCGYRAIDKKGGRPFCWYNPHNTF